MGAMLNMPRDMMDKTDVANDIRRLDYDDPEINSAIESVRRKCKKKGLPYRELFKSLTSNHVKYLLLEDADGSVTITDLDSGQEYYYHKLTAPRVEEIQAETTREKIQKWIKAGQ